MDNLKKHFCHFLFEQQVLLLGNFITKSKRKSPYFLNFGNIHTSSALNALSQFYLKLVNKHQLNPTSFFGPAYKAIPISLACSLNFKKNLKVSYVFNRKEEKKYGDKGKLVGKPLNAKDKIIIIDDVITAGNSFREAIKLIHKKKTKILAGIIGVDRMEKGLSNEKATKEISHEFNFPIYSLITIQEIAEISFQSKKLSKKQFNVILNHIK